MDRETCKNGLEIYNVFFRIVAQVLAKVSQFHISNKVSNQRLCVLNNSLRYLINLITTKTSLPIKYKDSI